MGPKQPRNDACCPAVDSVGRSLITIERATTRSLKIVSSAAVHVVQAKGSFDSSTQVLSTPVRALRRG